MIIGFTGSRNGLSQEQTDILRKVFLANTGEFHHGDCLGADFLAHQLAMEYGYQIWVHPPSNTSQRAFCTVGATIIHAEQIYKVRNKAIVDRSDLLIGMPYHHETHPNSTRSGTWQTIRMARREHVPRLIMLHDGTVIEGHHLVTSLSR